MQQPKRIKHRKAHRGRMKGIATTGATLAFGEWGLKTIEPTWLTARQIEASRRAIVRHFRRGGQVWIRVFADKPVTKKPLETRMGSGKANVDHWVAVAKRGRILFEVAGVTDVMAREGLRRAGAKLPVATKIVGRADFLMRTAGSTAGDQAGS
ncbi:MAG: 50S ribosomal protein L16 [Candidatus Brocadiia bacterium]|nr:50S ribosomal protein L16 [Candidatus Brocadiia bacterium]